MGKLAVDPLLAEIPGASLHFDFGSNAGWPSQTAPLSVDTVRNLANESAPGVLTMLGDFPIFAGGGIDFSSCTTAPNKFEFAGVLADIQETAAETWLFNLWIKLPSSANWPDSGVSNAIVACGNWATGVDFLQIYLTTAGATQNMVLRRGLASASSEALVIAPAAGSKNTWVQLSAWRLGGQTFFRIRSAAEVTTVSATSADNSGNFAALSMKFGLMTSADGVNNGWSSTLTTSQLRTCNFRLGRGTLFNLAGVTPDVPVAMATEWTRVLARGDFS